MAKKTISKPPTLNLSGIIAKAGNVFGGTGPIGTAGQGLAQAGNVLNAQNQNAFVNQQVIANQQAGLGGGALGNISALTGQMIQSPWEAFLAGREPNSTLAYEFLVQASNDGWARPLNIVIGDLMARIKELEDSNPWQKSYDQIADEKEAKDGA